MANSLRNDILTVLTMYQLCTAEITSLTSENVLCKHSSSCVYAVEQGWISPLVGTHKMYSTALSSVGLSSGPNLSVCGCLNLNAHPHVAYTRAHFFTHAYTHGMILDMSVS